MRNADAEEKYLKRCRAIGEWIEGLAHGRGVEGMPGGELTRLSIRMPADDRPECLIVVKVASESGDVVAFVGALDLGTAMLTWRAKDRTGGLKWRADRPWGE